MMSVSFEASHFTQLILCPTCGNRLRFNAGARLCCNKPHGATIHNDIIRYRPDISSQEMATRDVQAEDYLRHTKFPTQIDRMRRFITQLPRATRPVLDLGCGPGPTTQLLSEKGFDIIAVDFSMRSLELNKAKSALFVQADLNDIRFVKDSVDGLMMADFLQHLGGLEVQQGFLHQTFEALASGGWFFLSCFNANLKNWLRRDIDGSFASGRIRYLRLTPARLLKMLPWSVQVESVRLMNIFHQLSLDKIAVRFPLARFVARMIVVTGRKL